MTPHPTTVGLTLCDQYIIERGTNKRTTVGAFVELYPRRFPTTIPMSVAAVLIGGSGEGKAELVLVRLDTGEELVNFAGTIHFPDRLREIGIHFRLEACPIPTPGVYQFTSMVDGEWVAQKRFIVYPRGG